MSFNREAYDEATARRDLARTDLDELAQQVEDGEIDEETASDLRSGYEMELAAAEADLAKLGTPPSVKKPKADKPSTKRAPSERDQRPRTGFNSRWVVGAGVLIVALVVIIISVQNSSEPEPPVADGNLPGTGTASDPCAEMAAAVDQHPGNALRLALADCYTQSGNAMAALEHFRTVADSTEATPAEVGEANVGLGYLNLQIGQVTNAADYMRSALAADAANIEANYFLGMMLVYDLGDPAGGIPYLETTLAAPGLPESVVLDVEAALAVARGEGGG